MFQSILRTAAVAASVATLTSSLGAASAQAPTVPNEYEYAWVEVTRGRAVLLDFGLVVQVRVRADSSAAIGICTRSGIGKVRHLRTQGLWVQEVRVSGRILYRKVLGEKNPADLLTKNMSAELMSRHVETLNMRWGDD